MSFQKHTCMRFFAIALILDSAGAARIQLDRKALHHAVDLQHTSKIDLEAGIIDVTDLVSTRVFKKSWYSCCCDKRKLGDAGKHDDKRGADSLERANYCKIVHRREIGLRGKCGNVKVRADTKQAHNYESTGGTCEILQDNLPVLVQALKKKDYCPTLFDEFKGLKVSIQSAALGEKRDAICEDGSKASVECQVGTPTVGYWSPVQCKRDGDKFEEPGDPWCPKISQGVDGAPKIPAASQGHKELLHCDSGQPLAEYVRCSEKGWILEGSLTESNKHGLAPVCFQTQKDFKFKLYIDGTCSFPSDKLGDGLVGRQALEYTLNDDRYLAALDLAWEKSLAAYPTVKYVTLNKTLGYTAWSNCSKALQGRWLHNNGNSDYMLIEDDNHYIFRWNFGGKLQEVTLRLIDGWWQGNFEHISIRFQLDDSGNLISEEKKTDEWGNRQVAVKEPAASHSIARTWKRIVPTTTQDEDKSLISALPASSCPQGISFITDIEGDLDWFNKIVSISKALEWSGEATDGLPGDSLILKEGMCFVFGGDLFDRGPGDIRLARSLVQLKEDFPNRVFLLVANRDLNKLRFVSELSSACLAIPANKCTSATYDKTKADSDPLVNSSALTDRVQWILKYTMSARSTFEDRRKELAVLNGGGTVYDNEVAESFLSELQPPDGIQFRFLESAQLGIRIGETLFLPGSLPPDSLFFVPSLDLRYRDKHGNSADVSGGYLNPTSSSLNDWLKALNKFESDAMAAYKEKPAWDTPLEPFGGEALVCYQSPACMVGRAVVTESLYNRGSVSNWGVSPRIDAKDQSISKFLQDNGIKRFVTGGKPTGHMPLVTTVEGIDVIMADSSYSDDSFHEVLVQPDGFSVHGELHSDTAKGHSATERATKVHFNQRDFDEGLIGKKSPDGYWVQGKTEKGYHLFKQEGRVFSYKIVQTGSEVKQILSAKYEEQRISSLPADACPAGVSFVTDIEGDIDWFNNIVGISKALEWSGEPKDGLPGASLILKEGTCFVFGGDLFDRGPGDIRLARSLVQLKEQFPSRVFLLVANRDLNKLRLASELSKDCLAVPANTCTNAVYSNHDVADSDEFVASQNLADRVKWILKYTLGGRKTFEYRREELKVLNGRTNIEDVKDDAVAQSFLSELQPPHGIMFRFLEKGQLGIRIGETLFVPGSIPPEALLFVPSLDLRYHKHDKSDDVLGTYMDGSSLDDWLKELNKFESDAMAAYKKKPEWDKPLEQFGGETLVCYQSPDCMLKRAVVTESLYNRGAMSTTWGESEKYGSVAEFLRTNGVKRFCTGGKPTGHMPLVTTVEGIVVIMADTSYSDDSFHEVLVKPDGFLVHGELHSKTEKGTTVEFGSDDYDKGLIGNKSPDEWWVQGKTAKGFHLFKAEGRDFSYRFEDEQTAREMLGM